MTDKKIVLPVFEAVINENDELDFISLVDKPAIQKDYVLLAEQQKKGMIKLNRQMGALIGPVLIPDQLVYREVNGQSFFVKFSAESVSKLQQKWNVRSDKKFNIMHGEEIAPCDMLSSYIITDPKTDLTVTQFGFEPLPQGTWVGMVKITDTEFWEKEIASGNLKGFSIEGEIPYTLVDVVKMQSQNQNQNMENNEEKEPKWFAKFLEKATTALGMHVKKLQMRSVILEGGTPALVDDTNKKVFVNDVELPAGLSLKLQDGTTLFAQQIPAVKEKEQTEKKPEVLKLQFMDLMTDDGKELKVMEDMKMTLAGEPCATGEYMGTAQNGKYYKLRCQDGEFAAAEMVDRTESPEVTEMRKQITQMQAVINQLASTITTFGNMPSVEKEKLAATIAKTTNNKGDDVPDAGAPANKAAEHGKRLVTNLTEQYGRVYGKAYEENIKKMQEKFNMK